MNVSINKKGSYISIGREYFKKPMFFYNIIVYFTPIDSYYPLMKKGERYYLDDDGYCCNLKGERIGCGLNEHPVYWIGTSPNVIYLGGE